MGSSETLPVIKSLKGQLAHLILSVRHYLPALSHYHYDHTANANEFAGATWLVPQIEHNAMFAKRSRTTQPPPITLRNTKTIILNRVNSMCW